MCVCVCVPIVAHTLWRQPCVATYYKNFSPPLPTTHHNSTHKRRNRGGGGGWSRRVMGYPRIQEGVHMVFDPIDL